METKLPRLTENFSDKIPFQVSGLIASPTLSQSSRNTTLVVLN